MPSSTTALQVPVGGLADSLRLFVTLSAPWRGQAAAALELDLQAQREAVKVYGFDESHTGILGSAEVSTLLNAMLAAAAQ